MSSSQTFLVNEIYPCLQGEGLNLGRPSILVRLQICNLRCTWCDTPYTHTLHSDPVSDEDIAKNEVYENPNDRPKRRQKYKRISVDQIIDEIKLNQRVRHVIISGGEPTLQNISVLLEKLSDSHTIEIESNGTQIPHVLHKSFENKHYLLAQWNISPKGQNAGHNYDEAALSHWAKLSTIHPAVFFKFVIRKTHRDHDVTEVCDLVKKYRIRHDRVLLMAEGTSLESQIGNVWLEELCLNYGWTLSPRLHVLNHGSRRGV
jgi:organic radical activating enzyme